MNQLRTPEHRSRPQPLAPLPTCPACGHAMKLVSLEPHFNFNFLDIENYQCECSATLSFSVARLD
jgi:hypothetical protein